MKTTGFQYNGEFNANYDIIWSFKFSLCGSTLQSQGAFCTFLKESSSNLYPGLTANYLGYVNGCQYTPTQGISGALIGIAFDTTGYFALSTTVTGCSAIPGVGVSQIIPNSLIIRGPAPDCEVLYNTSLSSLTTNFTLLTTNETYCWLRFRMGNFFRTLTIDYRYSDDTQYMQLTAVPISIPIENTTFVNIGMSYSTPMTSSSTNEAIFRIKNFHVEGTHTYPNITLATPVTATITTLLTETSGGEITSDEVATEDEHIVLT